MQLFRGANLYFTPIDIKMIYITNKLAQLLENAGGRI